MSAEDVNASSLSSDDTITTETMACHCTQKSHRAKSTTNACGPSFFYDGNHTTLRASSVVKSSSPAPPKDQESPELSTKTADIFTGVFYKPIKDDCMPFEKCPPFKEVAARKDSLELQDDKIDEETLTPASVRFVVSPLISDQDIPTLRTRFSIALAKAAPSFPAARVILNTSKISIDIDTCIRRDFFDVFCDSQAHANHLGRLEQMTEAGEGFSTALYTMLCVGVGKPMYPRSIGVELLPVARPGKCLPSTVIADEDYMKALKKVIDSMHWKGSIPAGASHDESIIGLWRETSWLTRNGKTEHQPLLSVRAALKIPPPPFVTSRICAWVLNTHPDYDFRVNYINRPAICDYCRVAQHVPGEPCPKIVCRKCRNPLMSARHRSACKLRKKDVRELFIQQLCNNGAVVQVEDSQDGKKRYLHSQQVTSAPSNKKRKQNKQ